MKKIKTTIIIILFLSLFGRTLSAGPINLLGYPNQDPLIDTLRTQLFYYGDKVGFFHKQFFMNYSFYDQGFEYSIEILKNHPKLSYKLWMQPKPAPLVAIIPGLGSYFTSSTAIALAQVIYDSGYSVFIISNSMNWDFMQSASTTMIPGYTPIDSENIYYALFKIYSHLEDKYKSMITDKILTGYSQGGLQTLFISKLDAEYKLLNFSRFLAINPPVNLLYGLTMLDDFFTVSHQWTKTQKENKIKKGFATFKKLKDKLISKHTKLQFNKTEAKYIIGYIFHLSLVEMIMSIHEREDLGVLSTPYSWFSRTKLYDEINTFNYYKFMKLFAIPYYSKVYGRKITMLELNKEASLPAITDTLINNNKIRVLHNTDDFLLTEKDLKWLKQTLGDKAVFFNHGGHLGNLYMEKVTEYILKGLNPKSDFSETDQDQN